MLKGEYLFGATRLRERQRQLRPCSIWRSRQDCFKGAKTMKRRRESTMLSMWEKMWNSKLVEEKKLVKWKMMEQMSSKAKVEQVLTMWRKMVEQVKRRRRTMKQMTAHTSRL